MSENNDFFEETEQVDSDESFYERADEFIALANQFADADHQVSHLSANPGSVSASFMYANARYSVWHAACSYQKATDFKADRQVILDYYTEQFKLMLEDHLDEYQENFESYFPQSDADEVKRFV
jgi:hypothetical protein